MLVNNAAIKPEKIQCTHSHIDLFDSFVSVGQVCLDCWHCVKCGADFSTKTHLHPRIHSCHFISKQIHIS